MGCGLGSRDQDPKLQMFACLMMRQWCVRWCANIPCPATISLLLQQMLFEVAGSKMGLIICLWLYLNGVRCCAKIKNYIFCNCIQQLLIGNFLQCCTNSTKMTSNRAGNICIFSIKAQCHCTIPHHAAPSST